MLKIKSFVFNPFQVNSYLVFDENKNALLVDVANSTVNELGKFEGFLKSENLSLQRIINTHGHVDHLMGLFELKTLHNVPFSMHKEDEFLLIDAVNHARIFGLDILKPPLPDSFLSEGDIVKIGEDKLECIHVPGHSPGSLVFLCREGKFLISGDVLFKGSIGRSDLPGGNHEKLLEGIASKLFILDDDIIVYPGHGEPTTIGYEKLNNPFFQSY